MATKTFFPNASPGTTTISGWIEANAVNGTPWTSVVNASVGDFLADSDSSGNAGVSYQTFAEPYIDKFFMYFDTSSIPVGATLVSATISLFGNGNDDRLLGSLFGIVGVSGNVSNTALSLSDFNKAGATALSDTQVSATDWNTSAYNNFTLNTTGLSQITLGGITKLAIREFTYDIGGVDPLSMPGNENTAGISFFSSNQVGTTKDPKLVITYTLTLNAVVGVFLLVAPPVSLRFKGWTNMPKDTNSFTDSTKHSSSFVESTKHSTSFSNAQKSTSAYNNGTKHSTSWTDQTKQ